MGGYVFKKSTFSEMGVIILYILSNKSEYSF